MSHTLYLECTSGISGDMTVAALLDLGADEQVLRKAMDSLPVDGFEIWVSRVKKSGLDACDFHVLLDEAHENHDHDMEYLHGGGHSHGHEGNVEPVHSHGGAEGYVYGVHDSVAGHIHGAHGGAGRHVHGAHDGVAEHVYGVQGGAEGHVYGAHGSVEAHDGAVEHVHGTYGSASEHTQGSHHGDVVHPKHVHRNLEDILKIIEQAEMTGRAKKLAAGIFQILARAEAKAHGVPAEQVHFHEVGAVDSIVDILAAAVCLDNLDITEVIVPQMCEGIGTVRCQHGILPVPVPAVLNIVQEHGLPLHITDVAGELVTPTGAAIVAAVRTSGELPQKFTVQKTGLGAGKRKYACAGILRAMLIKPEEMGKDTICKLEANIDDSTGEMLGYVMNLLFQAGARDVHYIPVFMKKNRPAYQINVICEEAAVPELEEIIFRETTTIGIRRMQVERSILERKICRVDTSLGEAVVKVCAWGGGKRIYPEYESIAGLAGEHRLPYQQVYQTVMGEAEKLL